MHLSNFYWILARNKHPYYSTDTYAYTQQQYTTRNPALTLPGIPARGRRSMDHHLSGRATSEHSSALNSDAAIPNIMVQTKYLIKKIYIVPWQNV